MINDLKRAWRDAVDNFWHELRRDEEMTAGARLGAMRRGVAAARAELNRIETELRRTRRRLEEERAAERDCRRRETLAHRIDDDETARLARGYAERHRERASVLERKAEVLEAERELQARELDDRRRRLQEMRRSAPAGAPGDAGRRVSAGDPGADPVDASFRGLERSARDRAAQVRLDDLKGRTDSA